MTVFQQCSRPGKARSRTRTRRDSRRMGMNDDWVFMIRKLLLQQRTAMADFLHLMVMDEALR